MGPKVTLEKGKAHVPNSQNRDSSRTHAARRGCVVSRLPHVSLPMRGIPAHIAGRSTRRPSGYEGSLYQGPSGWRHDRKFPRPGHRLIDKNLLKGKFAGENAGDEKVYGPIIHPIPEVNHGELQMRRYWNELWV